MGIGLRLASVAFCEDDATRRRFARGNVSLKLRDVRRRESKNAAVPDEWLHVAFDSALVRGQRRRLDPADGICGIQIA